MLNERRTAKHMQHFFSGTVLSRLSGFGRDLAMAFAFGDHPSVAAFMVAFRLSNLFRRLLGEGPLQSAFIPHFEGLRAADQGRALSFFRQLTLLIAVICIGIIVISQFGLWLLSASGHLSRDASEIIDLVVVLLPGLFFICLYGLNLSFLQCHGTFFLPSIAPLITNVIWITAALLLRHSDPTEGMLSLAQWIVIGFFGQWLLTCPLVWHRACKHWREWGETHLLGEVKRLIRAFSMAALGAGSTQLNAFADAFFARASDPSGPVYLWYSIRLEQLALALFGLSCVAVVIPPLSHAIKQGDRSHAQALFRLGYSRTLYLLIPFTCLALLVSSSVVSLLYGRGMFSSTAMIATTHCLYAYMLGLLPSTLIVLFTAVCYAYNEFRMPLLFSLFSVAFHFVLNVLFVFQLGLGAISIALSTTLSACLNACLLHCWLHRKKWLSDSSWRTWIEGGTASLFASLCTYSAGDMLSSLYASLISFLPYIPLSFFQCTIQSALFGATFFACAWLLRLDDLLALLRQLLPPFQREEKAAG